MTLKGPASNAGILFPHRSDCDISFCIKDAPQDGAPASPTPSNPLDHLSPAELFDRGVMTPERYLCWQTPCTREPVRDVMARRPGLTLAEALDHLWWVGGL